VVDEQVPLEELKLEDVKDDKKKAKHGKLAAKSTGLTYQFQIMQSAGVPLAEIYKFADPTYWIYYFPPIAQVFFDCLSLGRFESFWLSH
jgi:leucyl-tRNA synthetase